MNCQDKLQVRDNRIENLFLLEYRVAQKLKSKLKMLKFAQPILINVLIFELISFLHRFASENVNLRNRVFYNV